MRTSHQSRFRKRRGASLIEFVMILPILIGFAAAVYHFSWVMGTKQRLRMVERQSPWHVARSGPWLSDEEIDDPYMLDRPVEVRQEQGNNIVPEGESPDSRMEPSTNQAMADLAARVAEAGDLADGLADSVLLGDHSYDAGRGVKLFINIPSIVGLWDLLDMDMVGLFGREGPEWRASPPGWPDQLVEAVQDEFLSDLDAAFKSVPAPGDGLAERLNAYCVEPWTDADGSD